MNKNEAWKIIYAIVLLISLVWAVGYKFGYDGEKMENTYIKKRMIKERKEKLWLQNRLRNCTDCNLLHYSLIQDCLTCKPKAAENVKLKALYIELQ